MFLLVISNSEISNSFHPLKVERIAAGRSIITLVTDDFLSHVISTPSGFSLIESPLPPSPQLGISGEAILARVDFDKHKRSIEIHKPTNSGKTIYYYINQRGELYCSTHISLLRKAGVLLEEDSSVLPEYFVYGYVMAPLTLYKGIEQVPVGGNLYVQLTDGKCFIKSRGEFLIPEIDYANSSIDTVAERVSHLLRKSIESLRPCSDNISVPFSGGLDSSILYKLCRELFGIDHTYSTGYPFETDNGNIEKKYALSASKALGTIHHYFEATLIDYLEGIIETIDAAEEPLAYTQSVMFLLLYRDGIPEDKNIVISGRGAESAFGVSLHGDIHKLMKMPWKLLSWRLFLLLIDLMYPLTRHGRGFVQNVRRIRVYPVSSPENIIWTSRSYASREWITRRFNVPEMDIINRRYEVVKPFEKRTLYEIISILDLLADASYSQSTWSKIAEKSGKILYHPFSDKDLLTYVYSVPWKIKFCPPKNILKKVAYQNGIPEFIINRPKSGFSVQTSLRWVDILHTFVPLCKGIFSEDDIHNLDLLDGKEMMTCWHMINYAIWKRLYINNEPIGGLIEELRFAMKTA